jgi:hypothetical protein
MSKEYKSPRPVDAINKDFTQAALRLGDLTFKVGQYEKDISMLKEHMNDLNFEALAAYKAESDKKAAEETAKSGQTQEPTNAQNP